MAVQIGPTATGTGNRVMAASILERVLMGKKRSNSADFLKVEIIKGSPVLRTRSRKRATGRAAREGGGSQGGRRQRSVNISGQVML